MADKHQKHAKLARPKLGKFGRSEIAFLGAPCETIEKFMVAVKDLLSSQYSIAIVDADHNHKVSGDFQVEEMRSHFSSQLKNESYDRHLLYNRADIVLVNGNHYEAEAQILLLDKSKIPSLERRKDQCKNVLAVVELDATISEYSFLDIPEDCLIFSQENFNIHLIAKIINQLASTQKPELEALILAGGKSSRMGTDKTQIKYGEHTALDAAILLAENLGLKVNVSIAEDSQNQLSSLPNVNYIIDKFVGMGPFGAICSAFMSKPNTAFLTLACDLPAINLETLERLVASRMVSKYATATRGKDNEFPEPLIAIYEPKIYQRMLQFLSLGYSCPRKVLINSDVEIIDLQDNTIITNVNTPEEYQAYIRQANEK